MPWMIGNARRRRRRELRKPRLNVQFCPVLGETRWTGGGSVVPALDAAVGAALRAHLAPRFVARLVADLSGHNQDVTTVLLPLRTLSSLHLTPRGAPEWHEAAQTALLVAIRGPVPAILGAVLDEIRRSGGSRRVPPGVLRFRFGDAETNATAMICREVPVSALAAMLAALFARGVNPNEGSGDCIPMHHVCRGGDVAAVRVLLRYGASLKTKDDAGRTPLLHACEALRVGVIRLLVAAGAPVAACDAGGRAPLRQLIAAPAAPMAGTRLFSSVSDDEIADAAARLLRAGASATTGDANGTTLLHHAISTGKRSIVALLLAHKARPNAENRDGARPLDVALTRKPPHFSAGIVRDLLDVGAVCGTPLATARAVTAKLGRNDGISSEFAAELVARGAFGSSATSLGPLATAAAAKGDTGLLQHLLDCGFPPNGVAEPPRKSKSDTYDPFQPGLRPLHAAARHRRIDAMELLLARGADIDAPSNTGHTALYVAAGWGDAATVECLIRHGADTSLERDMRAPFRIACAMANAETCAALLRVTPTAATASLASRSGDGRGCAAAIRVALSEGLEGESGDVDAVCRTLTVLIDAGADVNARDANELGLLGTVLLQYPNWHTDTLKIVNLLIARGADVTVAEDGLRGQKQSLIEVFLEYENDPAVVRALVNAGASLMHPTTVCSQLRTSIQIGTAGAREVARCLLDLGAFASVDATTVRSLARAIAR